MKANVQYNDFTGTAAADGSDHINLKQYLSKRGVDTERYDPVGVEFYHGERGRFYASFICIDSTNGNEARKIEFEKEVSIEEFFNLFKRFDVIILKKNIPDMELRDEPIRINDSVSE